MSVVLSHELETALTIQLFWNASHPRVSGLGLNVMLTVHHRILVYWHQRDALSFCLLRIKGLYICFEHYLLILRGCCTNGSWYIACV
jgi:hypothetical protein